MTNFEKELKTITLEEYASINEFTGACPPPHTATSDRPRKLDCPEAVNCLQCWKAWLESEVEDDQV